MLPENHFLPPENEPIPGAAEIRQSSETLAAKYPIAPTATGNPYLLDRALDGSVAKP